LNAIFATVLYHHPRRQECPQTLLFYHAPS
jgi:hypothetical protein